MKRLTIVFSFLALLFMGACGETALEETYDHEEKAVSFIEKEATATTASAEESEEEPEDEEDVETDETEKNKEEVAPQNLDELRVHYIDVGQADATLIQFRDGDEQYAILYDTGDWRGNEVVPYLQSQGVESLDLVIVSHPDADHIGQLDQVMNHFPVDEVWMSGNESSSQTFQRGVEAVLASDANYHEPRAGESFSIGPMDIDILYPESISGKSNEESISALFTYGHVKFVFTGDAGRNEETYMRNHFNVDADVLHLGHHGSKTSSDPAFIDVVAPTIAIYSAGAGNSYGHPSPEVVATVEDRGIELYGTDIHGTVIVTTNGDAIINVETVKTAETAKANPSGGGTGTAKSEKNDVADSGSKDETAAAGSDCIDINTASLDDLQQIIHIGPARANDLIELRPFQSVDDLQRISGIGPARIADIKNEGKACVQ